MTQTDNWDELVRSIVDNVLNRIEREKPRDEHVVGTLALFTTYVPSPKTANEKLVALYGEDIECALTEEADFEPFGFESMRIEDKGDEKLLLQKAASKGRIVLVTPKINLLKRLADGDDEGFIEHVMLRSLLWGRKVCILLDFDMPAFRRGTFFEKIGAVIDALTSMGIQVAQYHCAGEAETEILTLVTEQEIEQARRDGKYSVVCAQGAIITPLARERAAELNISIDC